MLNLDKTSWEPVRLGDVTIQSKEKVDPSDGTVDRYVAGEHMDTDDLKIHRWGEVADGYLGPAFHRRFHPGQILYGSRRTYLRKVAVADFDGVCANTTFVLDAVPDKISQRFLPFVMSSEPFHAFAIAESRGSVNPYVNWSDIARYEFLLPPLHEQERIADLLWALENYRLQLGAAKFSLHEVRNKNLWELVHTAPRASVKSVVREPVRNGISIRESSTPTDLMTVSISAVRNGVITSKDSLKYVEAEHDQIEPYIMQAGDFFVVRGNGNKGLVARGGLLEQNEVLPQDTFYPDLLMRVRFNPSLVDPEFGAAVWNLDPVHRQLVQKAKSTNGTWKVNGKDLNAHELPVPPLQIQREILKEVNQFISSELALDRELDSVAQVKNMLVASVTGAR